MLGAAGVGTATVYHAASQPQDDAMKAPSHLDDDQIERLSQLLDQRAVPFKGFNLEALDGYLSALAVAPTTCPPANGSRRCGACRRAGPTRPSGSKSRHCCRVTGTWSVSACVSATTTCPITWRRCCGCRRKWKPSNPTNSMSVATGRSVSSAASNCAKPAWDQWLDEHEWIDEIFARLDQLASGEVLGEDPAAPPTPISYRERLEIIANLPGMLADLHHHRIDALTPREPIRREATPDRNAPCPCGSGKKYKKCCGA